MTYVIRSMSTNDAHDKYGRAQKIVPYHIYLRKPEYRAGAWWTFLCHETQRYETEAEAAADLDRLFAGERYSKPQVAPIDADKRGLPPFWDRKERT